MLEGINLENAVMRIHLAVSFLTALMPKAINFEDAGMRINLALKLEDINFENAGMRIDFACQLIGDIPLKASPLMRINLAVSSKDVAATGVRVATRDSLWRNTHIGPHYICGKQLCKFFSYASSSTPHPCQ